jgi:hypothetical protein
MLKLKTGSKTSFMTWFAAGNWTSRQHNRRSLPIGSKRIKKYVSPNPPIPEPTSGGVPEAADTAGQVWVNTRSGKYWKSESRYYGTTKIRANTCPKKTYQVEYLG